MGDPRAVVPYHDPHDVSFLFSSDHHLLQDHNPTLSDIYSPSPSEHTPDSRVYPFSESYSRIPTIGKKTGVESSRQCHTQSNFGGPVGGNDGAGARPRSRTENLNLNQFKPLVMWPEPPRPYTCSCCFILREIAHTNGAIITKLELHGRLGMINHAVLENKNYNGQLSPSVHQYQMIDFCKKSLQDVKIFLKQYCEERTQAEFMMLPDPLSIYYEAVCTGFNWDEVISTNANDVFECSGGITEPIEEACNLPRDVPPTGQQTGFVQNNEAGTSSRTSLSLQRERTGKLTLSDLAVYFHLPIEVAAERVNLCPTVVKRICRRGGLNRWPHRKIKSIERQISKLQPMLASSNRNDRTFAEIEVEKLQNQITTICYGLPPAH